MTLQCRAIVTTSTDIVLLMASQAGLRISELAYGQAGTCLGGYVVQGFSLKISFQWSMACQKYQFIFFNHFHSVWQKMLVFWFFCANMETSSSPPLTGMHLTLVTQVTLSLRVAWGRKQDSIDQLHFTHGETIAQSKEVIHPQSQAAGAKWELGLQALRPGVSALRNIPV